MAKPEKEKCPRCGSLDFAKATDSDKRYCSKCQHVWVPGLEGMKRTDVVLAQAQKEVHELREALAKERASNKALQAEVDRLKSQYEPAADEPESEDEIFS